MTKDTILILSLLAVASIYILTKISLYCHAKRKPADPPKGGGGSLNAPNTTIKVKPKKIDRKDCRACDNGRIRDHGFEPNWRDCEVCEVRSDNRSHMNMPTRSYTLIPKTGTELMESWLLKMISESRIVFEANNIRQYDVRCLLRCIYRESIKECHLAGHLGTVCLYAKYEGASEEDLREIANAAAPVLASITESAIAFLPESIAKKTHTSAQSDDS